MWTVCAYANLFMEQLNEACITQMYKNMSYLTLALPALNSKYNDVFLWLERGSARETLQYLNFIPIHLRSLFQIS